MLKKFLKLLPEPLLTWNLYPRFIAAAGLPSGPQRVAELRVLVHLLPSENRELLSHLNSLLSAIAARVAVNKMSAANLATVIGPTLLYGRLDSKTSSNSLLGNINAANTVVETIISNHDLLFGAPRQEMEHDSTQETQDALQEDRQATEQSMPGADEEPLSAPKPTEHSDRSSAAEVQQQEDDKEEGQEAIHPEEAEQPSSTRSSSKVDQLPSTSKVEQPTVTESTPETDACKRMSRAAGDLRPALGDREGFNETAVSRLRSVRDQWRKRESTPVASARGARPSQ